ncbi:MAG: sarcosine oxidase subunit alpha family protein, partial [Kiloniellales bacterium]
MTQRFRTPSGGEIDRSRVLRFTFDGQALEGHPGDTLASALLANGVRLVGRSFKYHRPRGIYTAGPEEPNALVELGEQGRHEPNRRATQIELFDGLVARSQNRWPSLKRDLGAVANALSPLVPAGFYYKTFMWPASQWRRYERQIRRAAGMGTAPTENDRPDYDKRYAHSEVLVAGGGPAGLAAALAAARTGARVIIADERPEWGGGLAGARVELDGAPAMEWVRATVSELEAMPNVTMLPRATVFGRYDQNLFGVAVRRPDGEAMAFSPRQVLWLVRAREAIVAAGAIERPLVFAGNDRPGVMLASAARVYANRYGVRVGARAVVVTSNDTAYAAAADLREAGVEIAAVVDLRPEASEAVARARDAGLRTIAGHAVVATRGRNRLSAVSVAPLDEAGQRIAGAVEEMPCDVLCVSGGWSPTAHLYGQAGGRLIYDEAIAALRPAGARDGIRVAGAANGRTRLADCLEEGAAAGAAAAEACGCRQNARIRLPASAEAGNNPPRALWSLPPPPRRRDKCFVDLQDDVTLDDIALAVREGYESVEHMKRYTTLGMGTDQGKTSNVNGLAILAGLRGEEIGTVGTTSFRPPYTPVTMAAFAGRETGHHFTPTRRTPMHGWHERAGAVFLTAGLWLRPHYYPRPGEGLAEASRREAAHVRTKVGIVDVSTLGRIDIQGPDAVELLNRLYVNGWGTLPVGKVRYGLMLRDDGIVFDDGTTARMAENHFVMTTTTANAGPVMTHVEYCLQVLWPELDVRVASVTDQFAVMAVAGPSARAVLQRLDGDIDLGDEVLPFMGWSSGTLAGAPATVFRISFSGELSYEVAVPADYGLGMWERIVAAGADHDIIPYGTEAMATLRIEKGHFVMGAEADGRVTADDLGLGRMQSQKKDYIGRRSLARPGLAPEGRKHLVGLLSDDGKSPIPPGAQIVADPSAPAPVEMLGHVTSTTFSPALDRPIALAMVADGRERRGE